MNKAYLIHSRDYRETSLLIDFFTKEHGFIKAVARGVRGNSKHNKRGVLQLFTPLFIDWRGNSDLVTLTSFELAAQPFNFARKKLVIGFYINELLYYLLNKHPGLLIEGLFEIYEELLLFIHNNNFDDEMALEIKLRNFELELLDSIGYGLMFDHIKADNFYAYHFEDGFYQITQDLALDSNRPKGFKGSNLLAIKDRDWCNHEILSTAKKLLRQILQYHIGDKELNSRKLFFVD